MYWNKKTETMPVKERKKIQFNRLRKTVNRCAKNSFYKKKFKKAGFNPPDLKNLSDLKKIPFTTLNDLQKVYPFGLSTEPMENIVELHTSSGTTAKPTVTGYTQKDIDFVWSEVMARALTAVGVNSKDIVQNAHGYGLFTGGLGFHYGIQRIGATAIPISTGNTRRQIELMQEFGSTVLISTPGYALHLFNEMKKKNADFSELKLTTAMCGAEPWSEEMRKRIEKKARIKAFDMYGLSEVIGPGVASECKQQNGLHVFNDHFLVEVIDPKTGESVEPEEKGELVFTTITREGFPVLRYRTGDISRLLEGECECNRTHPRIDRISGRTDNMVVVKGVNVFPTQIESVILGIPEIKPFYQAVVERVSGLDTLKIKVETKKEQKKSSLKKKLEKNLKSALNITPVIEFVELSPLHKSKEKAQKLIDKRKL